MIVTYDLNEQVTVSGRLGSVMVMRIAINMKTRKTAMGPPSNRLNLLARNSCVSALAVVSPIQQFAMDAETVPTTRMKKAVDR